MNDVLPYAYAHGLRLRKDTDKQAIWPFLSCVPPRPTVNMTTTKTQVPPRPAINMATREPTAASPQGISHPKELALEGGKRIEKQHFHHQCGMKRKYNAGLCK